MSALDAAVTLAEVSGWSLSNLELNKLLYIAQMTYMGEHDAQPMFSDDFQAWKLGPVVPAVYAAARVYGSSPVRNLFHSGRLPNGAERDCVVSVFNQLKNASAWDLVNITHWEDGAWAKNFQPGRSFVPIPKKDIMDEYRKRASV